MGDGKNRPAQGWTYEKTTMSWTRSCGQVWTQLSIVLQVCDKTEHKKITYYNYSIPAKYKYINMSYVVYKLY